MGNDISTILIIWGIGLLIIQYLCVFGKLHSGGFERKEDFIKDCNPFSFWYRGICRTLTTILNNWKSLKE
mgnify:CR=1 FL=1